MYYNTDSSSEDDEQYQAKIGEKFKDGVYEIIRWLGNGTFSKVWLVKNVQDNNYYALKIQKESYSDEAVDEIKILNKIKESQTSQEWQKLKQELGCDSSNCVQLVDHFLHEKDCKGYYCMVMEILGPTLLELIRYFDQRKSKMSVSLVKHITKQILIGLVYIHQICQVIHTDIKPENIMVVLNDLQLKQLINEDEEIVVKKQGKIFIQRVKVEKQEDRLIWNDSVIIPINCSLKFKLVDFGNACPFQDQYEEIQTQEYKSPEAIIQAKYLANTDVWSLACVIFEMLTNNYLFDPEGTDEQSQTDDLLALMMEILGKPSIEFLRRGKRSLDYFEKNGELTRIQNWENVTLSNILIGEYDFEEEVAREIEEMLKYSLVWDPKDRPQSIDLFKHKWLQI